MPFFFAGTKLCAGFGVNRVFYVHRRSFQAGDRKKQTARTGDWTGLFLGPLKMRHHCTFALKITIGCSCACLSS